MLFQWLLRVFFFSHHRTTEIDLNVSTFWWAFLWYLWIMCTELFMTLFNVHQFLWKMWFKVQSCIFQNEVLNQITSMALTFFFAVQCCIVDDDDYDDNWIKTMLIEKLNWRSLCWIMTFTKWQRPFDSSYWIGSFLASCASNEHILMNLLMQFGRFYPQLK